MEASPAGEGYSFLMEPRTLWSVSVTLRTTLPALDGEGAYAVPGASQLWVPCLPQDLPPFGPGLPCWPLHPCLGQLMKPGTVPASQEGLTFVRVSKMLVSGWVWSKGGTDGN